MFTVQNCKGFAICQDEFAFSVCVQYACSLYIISIIHSDLFMLAKRNISCIYSLVDNACDMDIPVMEVNCIELTVEAEQG